MQSQCGQESTPVIANVRLAPKSKLLGRAACGIGMEELPHEPSTTPS